MSITRGLIDDVFLPYFNKNGEDALKFLVEGRVSRLCFLIAYKHLKPIEDIPNSEKIEWRKYVNEKFPGTTPEFRLEAIKIIYCIGTLIND